MLWNPDKDLYWQELKKEIDERLDQQARFMPVGYKEAVYKRWREIDYAKSRTRKEMRRKKRV